MDGDFFSPARLGRFVVNKCRTDFFSFRGGGGMKIVTVSQRFKRLGWPDVTLYLGASVHNENLLYIVDVK